MNGVALELLRGIAVVALGGAGTVSLAVLLCARYRAVSAEVARYQASLERDLAFLRAPVVARHVVVGQALLAAVAAILAVLRWYLPASLLVMSVLVLRPIVQARRLRRTTHIEQQLDGWLLGLASSLRATPAPGEAIEYSMSLVASPLRDELDTLVKEQRLGTALDEALTRMGVRIGSRSVQSALGTLRIGQRTGGDIPQILERSAAALREMARLEGVVRTKTAEGKAQAFVLAAIPFPMVGLLTYLNPGFLAPLLGSYRGHAVIAGAIVLWLASIVLARRILDVDI